MKKNLLLGLLLIFLLNTAAFAGFSDPKKESEKPAISDPKENKLSNEEINRLSKRAEIDNLNNPSLSNKEKNDSKNNLKPPNQDGNRNGRVYIGAVTIILIIILVLVLV